MQINFACNFFNVFLKMTKHSCPYCGKLFSKLFTLKRHLSNNICQDEYNPDQNKTRAQITNTAGPKLRQYDKSTSPINNQTYEKDQIVNSSSNKRQKSHHGNDDKGGPMDITKMGGSLVIDEQLGVLNCVFCAQKLSTEDCPKLLECLHGSCAQCVHTRLSEVDNIMHDRPSIIHCPLCNMASQRDFIIDNHFLIEQCHLSQNSMHNATGHGLTSAATANPLLCTACSDNINATWWCVDCSEYICDGCLQVHRRFKILKDHTIKPKTEVIDQAPSATNINKQCMCKKHPQEELSLFCETCEKLTCQDCQMNEHRNHNYLFACDFAAITRKSLQTLVADITCKRSLLCTTTKDIDNQETLIADMKQEIIQEVSTMVVRIFNTLDNRCKQLGEYLNEVCDKKTKDIMQKKHALQPLANNIDDCVDFMSNVLEEGSDFALLSSKRSLERHLQKLKHQRADVPNPDFPLQICIQLDYIEDLQQIISKLGTLVVDGKPYNTSDLNFNDPSNMPPALRPTMLPNLLTGSSFNTSPLCTSATPSHQLCNIQQNSPHITDANGVRPFRTLPNCDENNSVSHTSATQEALSRLQQENSSCRPKAANVFSNNVRLQDFRRNSSSQMLPSSSEEYQIRSNTIPTLQNLESESNQSTYSSKSPQSSSLYQVSQLSQQTDSVFSLNHCTPGGIQNTTFSPISTSQQEKTAMDIIDLDGPQTDNFDMTPESQSTALSGSIALARKVQELSEKHTKITSPEFQLSTNQSDDQNEDWCAVCLDGGKVVCCNKCPKVFHNRCHIPSIQPLDESESWECRLCTNLKNLASNTEFTRKDRGRLSKLELFTLQRICLVLCCQYEQSLNFRETESPANTAYYDIIKNPMSLNIIRTRLDSSSPQPYKDVQSFVSDVRLIFRNAYVFYQACRDPITYADAKYLEDIFEEQLQSWMPEFSPKSNNKNPTGINNDLESSLKSSSEFTTVTTASKKSSQDSILKFEIITEE